jgi:hypothetical protein
VLRRIFGPKKEEVTERWRRLHNEELHKLCTLPNIIRVIKSWRMRGAGHLARMGEMRNAYKMVVENSEGKRPLKRPRCRWEDNIRMDITEVGWEGVDWMQLAQERGHLRAVVNTVMNLEVP